MSVIWRAAKEVRPECARTGGRPKTRVLFVNSGILGLQSFSKHITESMRTLIDSASLRRAFGAAARADVVQRASPDDYRDKLRGIIQGVAQCGATTRRAGAPRRT
jgi:hypothetical protein